MKTKNESDECIRIHGAWQNNLKGIDLSIPLNKMTVITGVSGSGKSSLAFDTIYAEGQRRYVETFSSYARQFLDRMDKPRVDSVDGIPPAIAIDQTNPVRTSRSTVGTMTELNDHLKLLFARAAGLYCKNCGKEVSRDTPEIIYSSLADFFKEHSGAAEAVLTFPVAVPSNFSEAEVKGFLEAAGYHRIFRRSGPRFDVVQDRFFFVKERKSRLIESIETALRFGQGRLSLFPLDSRGEHASALMFSSTLHCPYCDITYKDPTPNLFSFNSPIGACEQCRGFGRTIGVDYGLVIPDASKSLAQGAIKPWQTESYRECQYDLLRHARRRGIPTDVAWRELTDAQRQWVIEGEGSWDEGVWYGIKRFFEWLESKSYRMHIRVLLSRYRSYTTCPGCHGARLKPEALLWRIGEGRGLTIHDLMLLPIGQCFDFFTGLKLPSPLDKAAASLIKEIISRLRYLVDVGLDYLSLDRQSRTLSGGEVQRINLTTALGTSLVNTLFVLDEPSIGLHPRDIGRLVSVLQKLRDAGNTLIVVEHDPDVIAAADAICDLGPGPGEHGGEIVYFGDRAGLLAHNGSLTAQYLAGKKRVADPPRPDASLAAEDQCITILGASEHNLKNIDVAIPLHRLVCITGVSGSGKSTLVQDICYNGLRKLMARPADPPGAHRAIVGSELIEDVILVDQRPIGTTARSNPVSYVGAFDPIRKLFASQPQSLQRGYTAGTFSFNAGNGRCPRCGGNGFERIEMQFLSDVYLRCPDCDGKRFRKEILEVTAAPSTSARAVSIADVLDMTVEAACAFFSDIPQILAPLEPLKAVGLAYMRLGQPLPTLSGGEAQRLKLAGHLAEPSKRRSKGALFLFDEPTTGLHFDDIRTLLAAFRSLLSRGHSVAVIEHNLDVIAASDWIIDLGPEGGEAGGRIVCEARTADIVKCKDSRTGRELARATRPRAPSPKIPAKPPDAETSGGNIIINQAREHNLRNVDVAIPRGRFTVITGVSGSGKSTLAFDILFGEGQRRYLESLNAFARQIIQPAPRPDVDRIAGVPPTVAIEQRTSRGGRKSTVATVTELYHFLRLLFVKLGVRHCPDCGIPIIPQSLDSIVAALLSSKRGKRVKLWAPLIVNRKGIYTELAQWAATKGFSSLRVDGQETQTDPWPRLARFKEHSIEAGIGECLVAPERENELRAMLGHGLDLGNNSVYVETAPGQKKRSAHTREVFSTVNACPRCHHGFGELDPRLFSFNSKHGWCEACFGAGIEMAGFDENQSGEEIWWNDWWEGTETPCSVCKGKRLNPEALAVSFEGQSIADFTALSIDQAASRFQRLAFPDTRSRAIARDVVRELLSRLAFLKRVGLGYLTLDRAAPSLSGGEAQRIRLAAQLGSTLRGVCYILDEPTIGLHSADSGMLLDTLRMLRNKGNTVVVVEHDEQTIRSADHIIDLGPGGGAGGGRIVAQGSLKDIMATPSSATGRRLASPLRHPLASHGAPTTNAMVSIKKVKRHNLKNLDVTIPLGRLVCFTGVSGSGKSTLVRDVLYENLRRLCTSAGGAARRKMELMGCSGIDGWEIIGRVLEVDQRPIGKTPRSCPATYVGFMDDIRVLFSRAPEAAVRGYGPTRFSFNVAEGRCPACEGQGIKTIEMSFLPDVSVSCDVCNGNRFTAETLGVVFKGKTIAEVLRMSVDEATEFFSAHRSISASLRLMREVGLGYLTLGQQSPTLSGGEAQRIKLVAELAASKQSFSRRTAKAIHSLYILDEPTIGLHMADVERLIALLHRLVEAGNSVVVIEHNLDIIAEADWIIDLGPGGGDNGGAVVAQGTPRQVAAAPPSSGSLTARFLKQVLER